MKPLSKTFLLVISGVAVGFWGGYGLADYRWTRSWPEMAKSSEAVAALIDVKAVEKFDRGDTAQARVDLLAVAKSRASAASRPSPSTYSWLAFVYGPFGDAGLPQMIEYTRTATLDNAAHVQAEITKACESPHDLPKYRYVCGG